MTNGADASVPGTSGDQAAAASGAPPTPPAPSSGLSETAACGLAYITLIPAIVFLLVEPYSKNKNIKFHCFQCIGLAVAWAVGTGMWMVPLLGWCTGGILHLTLFVCWLICVIKAFSGGRFKVPVIGDFAEKQAES